MDKKLIRKRMEEVINTNAIVTDSIDFLATHTPFKELKFCKSGISNDISNTYSEDQLFNNFLLNNMEKHNFIIVQGDNGSGKSHFIRWLKYKYDTDLKNSNEISILIERENNTLQATIKQLLSNDIIQKLIGKIELEKLTEVDDKISTDNFLTMIALNFASKVLNEEDLNCELNSRKRKSLYAFLSNEIVLRNLLLCKDGPIYRISKKLSNKDNNINLKEDARFTSEDFNFSFSDKLMQELHNEEAEIKVINFAEDLVENNRNIRETVAKYLNSKLENVIQESIRLNSNDFKNMLSKIRKNLNKQNKNLTLFIEDITSFTGIDKALIENIIHEHNKENGLCRLTSIIGITNGYYQNHLPDNLKDRITGRIIIDKDSILRDETSLLDVASRYINAIYLSKDRLQHWINNGAIESDLPLAKPIREWSTYIDNNGREFNLYPLTEEAIKNLYEELEIKTPRMFIKEILNPIFIKFTEEATQFPQSIDELSNSIRIPKFKDILYTQNINYEIADIQRERTKSLLRIWGDGTIETYIDNGIKYIGGVNEAIFEEFKVTKIVGRKQNINLTLESKTEKNESRRELINHIDINRINKELNANRQEFNTIKNDLDEWISGKSKLRAHSKIRDYIVSFLKESIFWDMEDVSSYLVSEAITKNNIVIEDQNLLSELPESSFCISKTNENYFFINALVQYYIIGKKKWNYTGSLDGILTVSKWIEDNKLKIISYVKGCNNLSYDIYKYSLLNKYYFQSIDPNISIEDLNKYSNFINNNCIIDNIKLKQVLGDEGSKKLKSVEFQIKENNDFILKFYNCKQWYMNDKTDIYYFDAKEIIKRVELLNKINWLLNDELIINRNKILDKWLIPYNLYKNFFNNKLLSIIKDRYLEVMEVVNDYKKIIGDENSIDEIKSEINTLYKGLKNLNKFYDENLYNKFKKLYIEEYTAKDIISILVDVEKKDCIDKVNILKDNKITRIYEYLSVMKEIDKFINSLHFDDSQNLSKNHFELNEKKNKLKEEIILIKNDLSKVNRGEFNDSK